MVHDAVLSPASWCPPEQPNALIGREDTVQTAAAMLLRDDCHLLTLHGGGGMGKTRLALAVTESLTDQFEDGACFVDLIEISDAASLPSLLAERLDLPEEGQTPLQRVKDYLRDRQLLLVLDNVEHVLPAAATVAELLQGCPRLKVLATSREYRRPALPARLCAVGAQAYHQVRQLAGSS